MAFGNAGRLGVGQVKTADSSWSPTSNDDWLADQLAVLVLALDNANTTDGETSLVTSVAIGGKAFTKAKEYTNSEGGAAAGATCSIWYAVNDTGATIPLGSTVTIALASSVTAKALTAQQFTYDTSKTIAIAGSNVGGTSGADPEAVTVSGLSASDQVLGIRGIAQESNNSSVLTETAGPPAWSRFIGTSQTGGGGGATNMGVRAEFIATTGVSSLTSDPTNGISVDTASAMVVFKEQGSIPAVTGTAATSVPHPTSAATGTATQPTTGTAATTVPAPTATANGEQRYAGSANVAVSSPTSAGGGTLAFSGVGAASVSHPTSSASGKETFSGAAAVAVPHPTAAGAGGQTFTGSAAASIAAPISSGTGTQGGAAGAAAVSIPAPTTSGTGAELFSGAGAGSVPAPASNGAGGQTFTGTADTATATPTALSAGIVANPVSGAADVSVPAVASSGAGTVDNPPGVIGTLDAATPAPSSSAAGTVQALNVGTIAASLPAPSSSGAGAEVFAGTMVAAVPSPSTSIEAGLGYAGALYVSLAGPTAHMTGTVSSTITSRPGKVAGDIIQPGARGAIHQGSSAGLLVPKVTGKVRRVSG